MEKTARAGASYQGDHPRAPAPLDTGAGTDVDAGVDVDASGDVDVAASAGDSKGSVESRLVMALVLR
jgi:hypothetical protein